VGNTNLAASINSALSASLTPRSRIIALRTQAILLRVSSLRIGGIQLFIILNTSSASEDNFGIKSASPENHYI
jgi:hypothetical protein